MSSTMYHDMHMTCSATTTMDMDHSTTMSMPSTTSTSMSMGDMEGMSSTTCKMPMMWNWDTVDSCFIFESWHVTSKGMFAGICIGVILYVMSLEVLRRSIQAWDRYLLRQHAAKFKASQLSADHSNRSDNPEGANGGATTADSAPLPPFRPNIWQQAIRALLQMMQFAIALYLGDAAGLGRTLAPLVRRLSAAVEC
ncbi:ctr copper transporter [Fusarium albosuccineum]|uniref:Copper transport protein n=1 Tax=Fusarium albosuccineum TaxID=1237068 RepID=A0A8H4L025_9HYPO|nr:ctr copper transporter [Fusarium albosuccineum]